MSFDLQMMRDTTPSVIALARDLAIYRDAQKSDRRVQRARNIADLLERGHRVASAHTAILIDMRA